MSASEQEYKEYQKLSISSVPGQISTLETDLTTSARSIDHVHSLPQSSHHSIACHFLRTTQNLTNVSTRQ